VSIRTYSGRGPRFPSRKQRKIDQHYEMAGLARQDGDRADETRHMAEIARWRAMSEEEAEGAN
jgi:hypothetical protein